jgi:hypothetical protein
MLVFSAFMACALAHDAWRDYLKNQSSLSFMARHRWYDDATGALAYACGAAALIHYLLYRHRLSKMGEIARPRRWRDRRELRTVLYVLAITLISRLAMATYVTVAAIQSNDAFVAGHSFLDLFPYTYAIIPFIVGVALIYWDHREAKRDVGLHDDVCFHCGYDLRASPEQCPECGRPRSKLHRNDDHEVTSSTLL